MNQILYKNDTQISPAQLAQVFLRSGIKRPIDDFPRLEKMLRHGNLLISAWDSERLVGIARALTDFSYCCYLSDLAVDLEYQRKGIGRTLIEYVHAAIGEESMLLLLAAPDAMPYYPQVGFEAVGNGWIIKRSR